MSQARPRDKLSISLPEASVLFVEQYRKRYSVASRSQVIDIALRALKERELEQNYAEAASEEGSFDDLDATSRDGIDDDPAW
jgi:antitoxin ParD1/3/4